MNMVCLFSRLHVHVLLFKLIKCDSFSYATSCFIRENGKSLEIWESLCNMTRGDEDFETQSLKFLQPPSLAVQFFRSPSPPLVVKISEPLS